MTLEIPDYRIDANLHSGPKSQVYRARRGRDGAPVILKCMVPYHCPPQAIERYRHQYELLQGLGGRGASQVCMNWCLTRTCGCWSKKTSGGQSLDHLIGSEALSLPDWLHLALAIVDALEQVHAGNVIHKDINPSNIIWNRDDGRLKLIDFGIATRLSREHPIIRSPKVLEGTLAYLAPEQTGRMNADIDYRADFYSLGASLYELMTGRRPFPSSDALELVHCHIAQRPPPPDQLTGSRVGHSVSEARGYFVSGKFDQLLAQTRKQEQSEHVLELVDQLNRGHRLITDSGERLHLAQMNLEAGRRAKHSTAYAAAVEYLQKGLNLLPGQHWEAYYELSMALHHEMIIASFLSGAHEASRDWARVTLEHAHSNLERAEIHRLVAGQQTMMAQYVDALDTVRRALGLLGIELPDGELWKAVHAEFASTRQSLGDTPIAELPHRPTISDPQVLTITRLLLKGLSAAFYVDHLLLSSTGMMVCGFRRRPASRRMAMATHSMSRCFRTYHWPTAQPSPMAWSTTRCESATASFSNSTASSSTVEATSTIPVEPSVSGNTKPIATS